MPEEHVPTREVAGLAPVDPLIAFFLGPARRGGRRREVERPRDRLLRRRRVAAAGSSRIAFFARTSASVASDYADACRTRDLDSGVYASDYLAADGEARVLRDVIKRLASVHDGHPDYDEAWRP